MKVEYRRIDMSDKRLAVVAQAEAIAQEFASQGYDLTLRQLYYQFVARGLIPNKQTEYDRLGAILNDARLGGYFDWDYMVDRTREEAGGDAVATTPEEAIRQAARWHSVPFWTGQPVRMEVWVEKEALAGVVERAAGRRRVTYFSCRGYTSASSMHAAAERLEGYLDSEAVERVVVLHLGDHDPSGIDMTRDITDRLAEFLEGDGYDSALVEVRRIALNMDQVRRYNPPPNPAKLTDSRVGAYLRQYGSSSWELDALDPTTLADLIVSNIDAELDAELWDAQAAQQRREREQLATVADRYAELLKGGEA